jgi:hypothetical protein
MPVWFIWALMASGLAAAISYRKSKELGVDPLASNKKTGTKP